MKQVNINRNVFMVVIEAANGNLTRLIVLNENGKKGGACRNRGVKGGMRAVKWR